MKRIINVWFSATVSLGLLVCCAGAQNSTSESSTQEQSLGNYARAVRQAKRPQAVKRFDNDNLPREQKLSIVGDATETPAAPGASTDQAATAPSDKPQVNPGQSQEERQAVYNEWQQKISAQKSDVDLASRELDVAQREYRLRAASFYADAGERLRNQAAWDKEDADYKQKIAEKQKSVDELKQKLSDLQEEARKAGVPSSVREAEQPQQ